METKQKLILIDAEVLFSKIQYLSLEIFLTKIGIDVSSSTWKYVLP